MKNRVLVVIVTMLVLLEFVLILSLFSPIYAYTNLVNITHKVHKDGGVENLEALNKERNRIFIIKTGIRFALIAAIVGNFILIVKIYRSDIKSES